jgi:hypothetical protein
MLDAGGRDRTGHQDADDISDFGAITGLDDHSPHEGMECSLVVVDLGGDRCVGGAQLAIGVRPGAAAERRFVEPRVEMGEDRQNPVFWRLRRRDSGLDRRHHPIVPTPQERDYQVILARCLYALRPDARSRLNTVFIASVFFGGAIGSALSGVVYAQAGWSGVAILGVVLALVGLGLWAAALRSRRQATAASEN